MAKFGLMFSVVLVLVLAIVIVESAPQGSPFFNMFSWLGQGVNRSGRPAADGGGPRRGNRGGTNRVRSRTRGRSGTRSRSRSGDGKYWNNYDKDGYSRHGRDVSQVLAASNALEAKFISR